MWQRAYNFFVWIFRLLDENKAFVAIRRGFVMLIPVITIGAFSLALLSIPNAGYQFFLDSFWYGFFRNIFQTLNTACFGFFSIYLLMAVSYSYADLYRSKLISVTSVSFVAFLCYLVVSGVDYEFLLTETFGVEMSFMAILVAILASALFVKLVMMLNNRGLTLYSEGTDSSFNNSLVVIFPAVLTIAIFAIFNTLIVTVLRVTSFNELFSDFMLNIFLGIDNAVTESFAYLLAISVFWFFGVHGNNVLENTIKVIFGGRMDMNTALLANNLPPTEIITKSFIDVFVWMGGTGAALCLLLAILFFSKEKNNRQLAWIALPSVSFNISEILIFGVPLVLNPILMIPFFLVPVISLTTSYFATLWGWIPIIAKEVSWTIPVFLNAYEATGSLNAVLLQMFNIIVGIFVYLPFVKLYERKNRFSMRSNVEKLKTLLIESENSGEKVKLLDRSDYIGSVSKMMLSDLKKAIKQDALEIYYQPQVNRQERCFGAEALLRWNYEPIGWIYPPLIIALACEGNILHELDEYILQHICENLRVFNERYGRDFKVSMNITAETLETDNFIEAVDYYVEEYKLIPETLWFEITEQTAISSSLQFVERLNMLKKRGHRLLIDDFGMGHTSLVYLQSNNFDAVKLDGSLTRDVLENNNSADIISSMAYLTKTLKVELIAEYVETEKQCSRLVKLGCTGFQGYLYSRPLPLDEFLRLLSDDSERKIKKRLSDKK